MRKIERQMNEAIRTGNNFSSSNTMVKQGWEGEADVYLHGNHIATVTDKSLTLFDGGWQSVTTKSRLNALLDEFKPGFGVFQKNWTWFVKAFGVTTVFHDGISIPLL